MLFQKIFAGVAFKAVFSLLSWSMFTRRIDLAQIIFFKLIMQMIKLLCQKLQTLTKLECFPTNFTFTNSKYCIKINKNESVHATFTLKLNNSSPVYFNNIQILKRNSVKYTDFILDRRLTWALHIQWKCITIKLIIDSLNNLISLIILLYILCLLNNTPETRLE